MSSRLAARRTLAIATVLAALSALVYARVLDFDFVRLDDPDYVTENPWVRPGLSWAGLRWAFTEAWASNWHPLTWLSHQLDVTLFGLDPAGHHAMAVLLHAANTALCFLALQALTRRTWPSAWCAAWFGLHPLHVESVAWISERKDLLSGTFFFLVLLAYARLARRQDAQPARHPAVLAGYALGLMAKPMLVTVPIVLWCLDRWPLGRFGALAARPGPVRDDGLPGREAGETARAPALGTPLGPTPGTPSVGPTPGTPSRAPTLDTPSLAPTHPGETLGAGTGFGAALEKVPLLVLALVSCALTLWSQRKGGSLYPLEAIPFADRVANALRAVVSYVEHFLWPHDLAYFYPHPALVHPERSPWTLGTGMAAIGLALAAVAVWRARRRCPALFTGVLVFLVMLLPVIGLVQVGEQAWADRYAYLPTLGLELALVFPLCDALGRRTALVRPLSAAALGLLALLGLATWRQTATWRDSEALFARGLAVTDGNYPSHLGLGNLEAARGRVEAARAHYAAALDIHPTYAPALYGLGLLEQRNGDPLAAIEWYRRATESLPAFAAAHLNLGVVLAGQGQVVEAAQAFERVLELAPDHPDAHFDLGQLLAAHGRPEAGLPHLEAAAAKSDSAAVHEFLGRTLEALRRHAEAIAALRRAASDPGAVQARRRLAWLLATAPDESLRDGQEARRLAREVLRQLGPEDPDALETWAAALAECGDLDRAIEAQSAALDHAAPASTNAVRARLERYRALQAKRGR